MGPWVFIGAVPLSLAAAGVFRWLARSYSRVTGLPGTSPGKAYVGGVYASAMMSASPPLARLGLYESGIRLAGSIPVVRWFMPVWEAQYAELAKADMVAAPRGRVGVRFSAHNASPIIFWAFDDAAEIVDILESRGVPVDRSVSRIGWAGL